MTAQRDGTEPITQTELVAAIEAATQEVFSTMLNVTAVPGHVFTEKEEAAPTSGVVSLIGLAGAWVGTESMFCSTDFACKIASQL